MAKERSGRAIGRPRFRTCSKAWKEPACKRCRSMKSRQSPPSRATTTWLSHSLSMMVSGLERISSIHLDEASCLIEYTSKGSSFKAKRQGNHGGYRAVQGPASLSPAAGSHHRWDDGG